MIEMDPNGGTKMTIEERVSALEAEVERLRQSQASDAGSPGEPWWKKIVGVYANDLAFDEAERLGREWRESFRPSGDEVAPL
jgi:hypothetical protein